MLSSPVCLGVIPARALSTRFPLKMLADLGGKPLVQHIWEAASSASRLARVVVATDDESIARAVEAFGGEVMMTSPQCPSGTDRVAEAATGSSEAIIVNLQGDEPMLPAFAIDALISGLEEDPLADMATLVVRKTDREELLNPNVVKAVISNSGRALYFSRSPLLSSPEGWFFKHIGIYAYRRAALDKFVAFPPSALEQAERLEQLRALENGLKIQAVEIDVDTIAVDTPSDIERVRAVYLSRAERLK